VGCFQSWPAPEWLFGSAWPGIEMDPDRICPFSFWPRTNPHLMRSGSNPPSPSPSPDATPPSPSQTHTRAREAGDARGQGAAARVVGVEARGDGVAERGDHHDDDDCRLLSGTPLPSPFSPQTLGLAVATAAAVGEPSMPPAAAKLALERRPEFASVRLCVVAACRS
jgi:hypothetical protein